MDGRRPLGHATDDPFPEWRQLSRALASACDDYTVLPFAARATGWFRALAAAKAALLAAAAAARCCAPLNEISEAAQWHAASLHVQIDTAHNFVCIDVCAGVGGFTTGAHHAGVPCIGAIEGCHTAAASYGLNHGGHPVCVVDVTDVAAMVAFFTLALQRAERDQGRQLRLLVLASPPCQPFSEAGLRRGDDDDRAQVTPAIVEATITVGAFGLVVENVEPFQRSASWATACKRLQAAGFATDSEVIDTASLRLPQRRRRMIGIALRGRFACGMRPAALALDRNPPVAIADLFPDVKYFWYNGRFGKQVYSAAGVTPALKCNCARPPPRNYQPRARDDAPVSRATVFSLRQLAAIQGFPAEYVFAPHGVYCDCRFCSSSKQLAAGRQIGNSIAPPMAEWALRRALEMALPMEQPDATNGTPPPAYAGSSAAPLQAVETTDPAEDASRDAGPPDGTALPPAVPPTMTVTATSAAAAAPTTSAAAPPPAAAGSRLQSPHGASSGPRGMNGGGDDHAIYDGSFRAHCRVARDPPAPRDDHLCIAAFGRCQCCVCVLEPRLGDHDPWHPDLFEDATSCHMNEVRRATRRAQWQQLQRSDVRRDNTATDFRHAVWTRTPTTKPRAGDPRSMLSGYVADVCIFDDDAPTQDAPTSTQHEWWLRFHRASCAVCAAHERAQRFSKFNFEVVHDGDDGYDGAEGGFTLNELPASATTAAPGCYGRYLVHSIRAGFDPLFDHDRECVSIPNHSPVYEHWPATVKYFDELDADVPGVYSAAQWRRGPKTSPLLTVVRPAHMAKALRDGTIPKARVVIDVKAGLLNEALADWLFTYEDVGAVVRLIERPGCVVAKLDLRKYFLFLAASPALQDQLWFSDPRHEPTWGGKGPPHPSWRKPPRHARWRHFRRCVFGIKTVPGYANFISGEVARYLRMMGCSAVTFLTDDYFIVEGSFEECRLAMDIALQVFTLLGLESPPKKNEGPAHVLDFLGVTVDSRGELITSFERLDRALHAIRAVVAAGTVTAELLRRIAGTFSWLCGYIRGSRAFLRSTWNLLATAENDDDVLTITTAFTVDVEWWEYAITRRLLSGSRIFYHGVTVPTELFKSDGSGSGRFGFFRCTADNLGLLVWGALPLVARWDERVPYVELFAVWAAAMLFAHEWSGLVIRFGIDSACVCDNVNTGTSPDAAQLLLLQHIAALQAIYRFDMIAHHCTRTRNELADCTTRFLRVQEIRGFLNAEGFAATAAEGTPLRCRWRSPLASGELCALPLGRRLRSR